MSTVKAALLSTLALASAEILLAPEDVPIECAAICGPVVELTRKCSLGMPIIEFEEETFARVKRRKVDGRGRGHVPGHLRVHDKAQKRKRAAVTNGFGQVVSVPSGLTGGQTFTVTTVVTVTAAPSPSSTTSGDLGVTTPPTKKDPESPTMSVMTTTMTMVVPDGNKNPSNGELDLPTHDTPEPTSTPPVVESGARDDGRHENVETEEAEDVIGQAERECVCENKSFDVEKISGLCASCIWQSGYMLGSECPVAHNTPFPSSSGFRGMLTAEAMRSVMNQCEFSDEEYTPSDDSVVNDIRVGAERPTLPDGAAASLDNASPPSPARNADITWALVMGVACAIAFMV